MYLIAPRIAITKPQTRKLAEVEVIQLGLFDQVNLVEFESEDYPDERLIACRNPLIAQINQLQREALLEAAEKELDLIVQATQREKRALKGQDNSNSPKSDYRSLIPLNPP